MKKIVFVLFGLLIIVSFLFGCATVPSKTQIEAPTNVEVEKSYRMVVNEATDMTYYIPANFPNPFSEKEVENYTGQAIPFSPTTVMVIYYNETETHTYGLVFENYTQILVVAASFIRSSEDTTEMRFWIYPEEYPVECSEEEQKAFLTEKQSI